MKETGNRIVDLSFAFALEIISFVQELEKSHKYAIANQVIRTIKANSEIIKHYY